MNLFKKVKISYVILISIIVLLIVALFVNYRKVHSYENALEYRLRDAFGQFRLCTRDAKQSLKEALKTKEIDLHTVYKIKNSFDKLSYSFDSGVLLYIDKNFYLSLPDQGHLSKTKLLMSGFCEFDIINKNQAKNAVAKLNTMQQKSLKQILDVVDRWYAISDKYDVRETPIKEWKLFVQEITTYTNGLKFKEMSFLNESHLFLLTDYKRGE